MNVARFTVLIGFSPQIAPRRLPMRFPTCGKRLVVLVGQKKAVAIAVRNAWQNGCALARSSHGNVAWRTDLWWLRII